MGLSSEGGDSRDHPVQATHIPVNDSYILEVKKWVSQVKGKEHHIFPRRRAVFGYVYSIDPAEHMGERNIRRLIKESTGFWPHYLRHMRISHIAPNMLSPYQLKAFTHHKSVKSLDTYVHLMPSMYEGKIPIG